MLENIIIVLLAIITPIAVCKGMADDYVNIEKEYNKIYEQIDKSYQN